MNISEELSEIIVNPHSYAQDVPLQNAFRELRANNPLGVAKAEGYDPFWVVTKFDDIQTIEKANDKFLNEPRSATLTPKAADEAVREFMGGSPNIFRTLVQMDNPDHRAYRMLTQNWFMPQNLRKLDVRIREIANTFIDRMHDYNGECDFARDIAFLYPLHVIMEILGVPEADEPRMLKLTQELFGAADPELNRSGEEVNPFSGDLTGLLEIVGDFTNYFNAITDDRRSCPRDDVSSVIANGTVHGEPLGHLEAMSYYVIAATAGHDTTSATTAGGLWALMENPDQMKLVWNDPSKIAGFTEESIRWITPVKHFMRTAVEDTEIRGRTIKKDDWLMLCYMSGNRDEDVFDSPYQFNIERSPNKHVAMGYGAHICLGQHLARMEINIFWEEFFKRVKSVELNGEPSRMIANFVCGPKSVPIKYVMS